MFGYVRGVLEVPRGEVASVWSARRLTRPVDRVAPFLFAAGFYLRLTLLLGCATVKHAAAPSGYCAPPAAPVQPWREDAGTPGNSRVTRVAALLGVSQDLAQARTGPRESALVARLHVFERLEAARALVDATVAELDCEGERTSQLASYLEDRERRSALLYTASSIVAGAATGTASAFLAGAHRSDALQEGVAAGGGALTAGLGLVPLFQHLRAEFSHPRNMLTDVWNGPAESSVFPPLVWAYLSRPEFSNAQSKPIRERIVERWQRYEALAEDASAGALILGAGGVYDVDLLRRRADMLDQLKAEVDLMNQDLAELATSL